MKWSGVQVKIPVKYLCETYHVQVRRELTERGCYDDDAVTVLGLVTQGVADEVEAPQSLPRPQAVCHLPHVCQAVVTRHELGQLCHPTQLYDAV